MSVARNSVLVLVPRVTSVASLLATAIITARYLGPAGKGVLSLSALLIGMAFLLADVGLSQSLIYHVSKGAMTKSVALAVAAYGTILLGGGVIGVALLAEPIIRPTLLEGMSPYVYLMTLLSLPGVMFGQLWVVVQTAGKHFTSAAVFQLATASVNFVVALTVLAVVSGGIEELVTANATLMTAAALLVLFASSGRHGFAWRLPRGLAANVVRYGLAAYGGGLSNYALLRLDMIILNMIAGNAVVGQYSVAVSMTESLWHIDSAIGRAAMPDVVASRRNAAAILVANTGRMMILVGGIIGSVIFVLAPQLVGVLFGDAFLAAVTPLRILLPGALFLGVARLVLQYHQGQLGRPAFASLVMAGSAVMGLGLYMVLVPEFGIVGAAAGSTLVYTATLVVALISFTREARVSARRVFLPDLHDVRRLTGLLLSPIQKIFARP